MVKNCYVLNCSTGRKSCRGKFSLFKAPKDEELLEKWRHTVPQKERILRSSDCICEKHFEKDCVISRWQPSSIGGYLVDNIRSKLTPEAVPTIFLETDRNDPRIIKYVPERTEKIDYPPQCVTIPSKSVDAHFSDAAIFSDVEVSETDCVQICFNCLRESCYFHPRN